MSDDDRGTEPPREEPREEPREQAPDLAKEDEERRKTLYVGQLPSGITPERLTEVFGKYGPINDVRIPNNPRRGNSSGFVFIIFENAEDAKQAEEMNGQELDGSTICANIARYRKSEHRRDTYRDRDRDRDHYRRRYRDDYRDRDDYRGRDEYRGGYGDPGDRYRDDRDYRRYDDYRDRDRDRRYRDDDRRDDYRYDRYERSRDSRYDRY